MPALALGFGFGFAGAFACAFAFGSGTASFQILAAGAKSGSATTAQEVLAAVLFAGAVDPAAGFFGASWYQKFSPRGPSVANFCSSKASTSARIRTSLPPSSQIVM